MSPGPAGPFALSGFVYQFAEVMLVLEVRLEGNAVEVIPGPFFIGPYRPRDACLDFRRDRFHLNVDFEYRAGDASFYAEERSTHADVDDRSLEYLILHGGDVYLYRDIAGEARVKSFGGPGHFTLV